VPGTCTRPGRGKSPPGLGGFAYDSARGELVPVAHGSFAVVEQELRDYGNAGAVRASNAAVTWSLRPRRTLPGLLGDLGFRGELQLLEHVRDDSTSRWTSWIPGYLTIGGIDTQAVSLAHCYYEQRITWEPDSVLPGVRGELTVRPHVKEQLRGREEGIRGSAELERTRARLFTSEKLTALRSTVFELTTFALTDLGIDCSQRYRIAGAFHATLGEQAGWAARSAQSGWYGVVRPGVLWKGAERGTATLEYAFAYVDVEGQLDYSLAKGFAGGMTHRIDSRARVQLGEHFQLSGGYRGSWEKPLNRDAFLRPLHALTTEIRAML